MRNNKGTKNNSVESYTKIVRFVTMVMMVVTMYISATFSKSGFSFEMGGGYSWMGWGLAILTTVIQLAWNRMDGNKGLTIYSIGLVTYGYSIYTNTVGIYDAQGGGANWIFAALLGLFLDIVPEPFFIWAWTNGRLESDPLGKIVSGADSDFISLADGEIFNSIPKNNNYKKSNQKQPQKQHQKQLGNKNNVGRNNNRTPSPNRQKIYT